MRCRILTLSALAITLCALGACEPSRFPTEVTWPADPGLIEPMEVQPVFRVWIEDLTPGAAHTLSTIDSDPGTEPVLHVLDEAGQQLGSSAERPGSEASVTFQSASGTVLVVVRARHPDAAGRTDLALDGDVIWGRVDVGLTLSGMTVRPGWAYQTVLLPWCDPAFAAAGCGQPAADTLMIGVDETLHTVRFLQGAGSRSSAAEWIATGADAGTRLVIAAPSAAAAGRTVLYANDHALRDEDGDELGTELEGALGTCDHDGQTLDDGRRCDAIQTPWDSDEDGIEDGRELLGFVDPRAPDRPQRLRTWGAWPARKDVFVEVDHAPGIELNDDDLTEIADAFGRAPASSVQNPDGSDGIVVHLDVGRAPIAYWDHVWGDWGGSDEIDPEVETGDYRALSERRMSIEREGVFRYAYLWRGGQAQGWRFGSSANRGTFAHELGHTLGLDHHGDQGAVPTDRANCKPHYPSIMSYAMTWRILDALPDRHWFSTGGNEAVLDPSAVLEVQDESVWRTFEHLDDGGLGFAFDDSVPPWLEIDFARDGLGPAGQADPAGQALRAPVTMSNNSCGFSSAGLANVALRIGPADTVGATPRAAVREGYAYAFWVDDGTLRYDIAPMDGPLDAGSCPDSDWLGESCTTWRRYPWDVPTDVAVAHLDVLDVEGELVLAYVGVDGSLRVLEGRSGVQGRLLWEREVVLEGTSAAAPSVSVLGQDVAAVASVSTPRIGVVWTDPSGEVQWASRLVGETDWRAQGCLQTTGAACVVADRSIGLAVTAWPHHDDVSTVPPEDHTDCATVMGQDDGLVQLWCMDPASLRWTDVTGQALPARTTVGDLGLVYHAIRTSSGRPTGRGQLWLSYVAPFGTDGSKRLPRVLVLTDPRQAPVRRFDVMLESEWVDLQAGSGVDLVERATVGAMKGIFTRTVEAGTHWRTDFMPLADGTFRAQLRDNDDYRSMARHMCARLREASHTVDRCGG